MKPWEKYQQSESSKPWEKFSGEGAKADPVELIQTSSREEFGLDPAQQAKVSVVDFLSNRHGVSFDAVSANYEPMAKQAGLSGNPESDYQAIQHRQEILEGRKNTIIKRHENPDIFVDLQSRFDYEARAAKRYGADLSRAAPAAIAKASYDALAGTVDLISWFAGMGDVRGDRDKFINLAQAGSKELRELADFSKEAYGVSDSFDGTLTDEILSGAGTIATALGTRGLSIYGQMFTEAKRDAEASQGLLFEEMDEETKESVVFTGLLYTVFGSWLERAGLGRIAPKWMAGKANVTKGALRKIVEAGLAEGATESAQGQLLDSLAVLAQGSDRELIGWDVVKQRLKEFGLGSFLGTGFRAGVSTLENSTIGQRGEIKLEMDRNLAAFEQAGVAPSLQNLARYLDPMEGATPIDWKLVDMAYEDEEVSGGFGDPELGEIAIKAKHGDEAAQAEYIERTTVDVESDPNASAGITDEEFEILGGTDTSELDSGYYDLAYPEYKEDSVADMIEFFEHTAQEGSTFERVDAYYSMAADMDALRAQGLSEPEIQSIAFERIQTAGENIGQDLSGVPWENLQIFGKNEAEFKRNVFRDVSRIYKDADPFTVIEESTHGFFERSIATGLNSLEELTRWKQQADEALGRATHSNDRASVKEWYAEQAKARLAGKSEELTEAGILPPSFQRFLSQLTEYIRHILSMGMRMKELEAEGKLEEGFIAYLDRSLGLDEDFLAEQYERQNIKENAPDPDTELMAVLRSMIKTGEGSIPTPDSDPTFRDELKLLRESFGNQWSSLARKGGTLDGLAEALRERGFPQMKTPNDVLDALDASARGEKLYGFQDERNAATQREAEISSYNGWDDAYSMGIDETQAEAYITHHEIPVEKEETAKADLLGTLKLASYSMAQAQLDLDLYGGVGRPDQSADSWSGSLADSSYRARRLTEAQQLAQSAFIKHDAYSWSKALEANEGSVSAIIPELVKDPDYSWNVKGAIVRSPADAAALLRVLRSPYIETMKIMFLDKQGVVLANKILSVGNTSSTMFDARMIARELAQSQPEGAAGVIVAHNHPSGNPDPSRADIQVTRQVGEVLRMVDLPLIDHVITNGSSFYSFEQAGLYTTQDYASGRISKKKQAKSDTIYKAQPILGDELDAYELVSAAARPILDSSDKVNNLRKSLSHGTFVVFLDQKNRVRGIDQIPEEWNSEEAIRKQTQRQIFEGIGRNGSTAFVVVSTKPGQTVERKKIQEVRALREFSKSANVNLLDYVMDNSGDSEPYYSFEQSGLVGEDITSYSITPSVKIKGDELPRTGGKKAIQKWAKDNLPDQVDNPYLGTIKGLVSGVRKSIGHGMNTDKVQAISAIPEVLKQATLVDSRADKKGRPLTVHFLASSLTMGNRNFTAVLEVREDMNGHNFYLHEVFLKEKLHEAFKTGHAETVNATRPRGVMYSIALEYEKVKNALSMRPREDAIPVEERPLTKEEIAYTRAHRAYRESKPKDPQKKIELDQLRIRAVESRRRQRMQASAMRKLEKEVQKRIAAIDKLKAERGNVEEAIRQLEDMVQKLPAMIRGKYRGFATLSKLKTPEAQERHLDRAKLRLQSIFDDYFYRENRNALIARVKDLSKQIKEAKAGKKKLSFDSAKVEEFLESITMLKPESVQWREQRILKLQNQLASIDDERISAEITDEIEENIAILSRKSLMDPSLNAKDIKALRDELETLAREGRTIRQNLEAKRRAVAETATRLIVEELGSAESANTKNNQRSSDFKDSFTALLRPETITEILTGKKDSILKKYVFEPIFKAEQNKVVALELLHERFEELLEGVDTRSAMSGRTLIEIQGQKFTTDEAMAVYAYSKNERGVLHLESSVWGKVRINRTVQDSLIAALSDAQRRAVDSVIEYFDQEQYPRIAEVFQRETGAVLPKEENYFPIKNLNSAGAYADVLSDFFNAGVSLNKGMLKARQNSVRPFQELSFFNTMVRGALAAEHYIAYADALKQANAILMSEGMQQTLWRKDNRLGAELRMWLRDVANGRIREGQKGWDRVINVLRRNATVAVLGFNLVTAIKQPASFFPALRRGDAGSILHEAVRFADPRQAIEMVTFARGKSAFLRSRTTKLQTELAELAQQGQVRSLVDSTTRFKQFQDIAFAPMQFVDGMTATVVWMGQFRSGINKGLDEDAAIREADMLVRQTQSTGDLINSARLYRSGGLTKAMLSFTTDLNMALNNMVSDAKTDRNKPVKLAQSIGMYYVLPAVWMAVFGTLGRELYQAVGLDDEEEDNLKEIPTLMAGEFVGQVSGGVPLMNWMTGLTYKAMGDTGRAYFQGQIDPVTFSALNEIGMGTPESVVTGAAFAIGVPGVPLWKKLIKKIMGE